MCVHMHCMKHIDLQKKKSLCMHHSICHDHCEMFKHPYTSSLLPNTKTPPQIANTVTYFCYYWVFNIREP